MYLLQDLAFDLSLSALLGENIYNFGELLAHPVVSLAFDLILRLNSNHILVYDHVCLSLMAAEESTWNKCGVALPHSAGVQPR